jgi:hypothetical protein
MQALALGTGLEGSERYGLVSTVTAQIRMHLGIMRGAAMNVGAILAGDFVTAVGVACLFLANYYIRVCGDTISRLRVEPGWP